MNKKKSQGGFSMIEIMIVLAIAAIILAGVLVVVPALQRSARNHARKTDVGLIVASLIQYKANNGFPYSTDNLKSPLEDTLSYYEFQNINSKGFIRGSPYGLIPSTDGVILSACKRPNGLWNWSPTENCSARVANSQWDFAFGYHCLSLPGYAGSRNCLELSTTGVMGTVRQTYPRNQTDPFKSDAYDYLGILIRTTCSDNGRWAPSESHQMAIIYLLEGNKYYSCQQV